MTFHRLSFVIVVGALSAACGSASSSEQGSAEGALAPEPEPSCLSRGSDPSRSLEVEHRSWCTRKIPAAGEAQDLCVRLVANAEPNVAQQIANAVHVQSVDRNGDPRTMSADEVYEIGVTKLHQACLEDDVVPLCEEGVRGLVGNGASNAGGRLTKECRSLLSGLKPKARVQMKNLMMSIENAEEFTREARGLSRIVKLLIPCLEPAPGICEDNAAG